MILSRLFDGLISNFRDIEINQIKTDSRKVVFGDVFVAIKGNNVDGHDFIPQAIKNGAKVIVANIGFHQSTNHEHPVFISASDTRAALSRIADRFYSSPSKSLRLIGVTGTNGKTTITYILESILKAAGHNSGVIGTINYRFAGIETISSNTTPGALDLQAYLKHCVDSGADYFVMEVSSHALDQRRVDGLIFRQSIFTNLTQDHLDYHGDMNSYFNSKIRLFEELSENSIINVDDGYGKLLEKKINKNVLTYAIDADADIKLISLTKGLLSRLRIRTPKGDLDINTSLPGAHNIYNILACIGAMVNENIPLDKIRDGIEGLKNVPGRLENIDCGQDFKVFVDYAHTPDGLDNALKSLRPMTNKRLILVFGCGGDRDRAKRHIMGKLAGELADYSIITSDNPRSEEPLSIAKDILVGFDADSKKYDVILDRQEAIKKAIETAGNGDIVLLAGKGHEACQIFKDKTISFDDRFIAKEIIKNVYSK